MTQLILAALFFTGLHFGVAGTSLRNVFVDKLGKKVYRIIFSVLSLAGLVWLARSYGQAGYIETWGQLVALKPVIAPLVLLGFLLVVLGLTTPNPTSVRDEGLLQSDVPAQGVMRITRHPFLWGIALWAFAHLLVNGDVASLIFFGSLLTLVLGGMRSIDVKRQQSYGEHWQHFAEATSIIPFAAILKGRNRLVLSEFKWWQSAAALAVYLIIAHFHQTLFGVAPM
jgi:uncharacterized membrane protein